MSETSSRVRLMANLQAAVAEAVSGTMEERGRGFASDREAWSNVAKRNAKRYAARIWSVASFTSRATSTRDTERR